MHRDWWGPDTGRDRLSSLFFSFSRARSLYRPIVSSLSLPIVCFLGISLPWRFPRESSCLLFFVACDPFLRTNSLFSVSFPICVVRFNTRRFRSFANFQKPGSHYLLLSVQTQQERSYPICYTYIHFLCPFPLSKSYLARYTQTRNDLRYLVSQPTSESTRFNGPKDKE